MGAREEYGEVSHGGGAGGETAGLGLPSPVLLQPVCPVAAMIILDWIVAARTIVAEEPQVVHRGWAPGTSQVKEGQRNRRLGKGFASATRLL